MSETLLAIFLVTSSAKGSSLVYRWPPLPEVQPRLARPRPKDDVEGTHADNPWRAANMTEEFPAGVSPHIELNSEDEDDYVWRRPRARRDRSLSFSQSRSHPNSRRPSPSKDRKDSFSLDRVHEHMLEDDDYTQVLGFSSEFLATLLCPQRAMCHQKFELIVDDLAFIGHPVCVDADGMWRFQPEKVKTAPRGRGSKKGQSPTQEETSLTPEKTSREKRETVEEPWLQTFHLVLVLDLPDPSSSDSGNVSKYFDTIYEQIAFPMAAVLYQEQVLNNFVEAECEVLGSLENGCISKGEPLANFMAEAPKKSTIATSMKALYESIKDNTIARLTIHDFSFELQLPPYLDELLHYQEYANDDHAEREDVDGFESFDVQEWGPEMSFAWHLPALAPWKSLLRLDDGEQGYELHMKLRGPQLNAEDRELAEQLLKFLDLASIHLCLADMASLLDWDLETQVYPTVRWLIHHRRAKLIDTVHPGLKTLFIIAPKLPAPLARLSEDFAKVFGRTSVPPLPKLLSMITAPTDDQTANHFYANVVKSKESIPVYHDVVAWLLKHDLLISLHLYIRIVATHEMKDNMALKRSRALEKRRKDFESCSDDGPSDAGEKLMQMGAKEIPRDKGAVSESSPVDYWVSMSPKSARRQTRHLSPAPAPPHPQDDHSTSQGPSSVSEKGYGDMDEEDEEEDPEEAIFREFDASYGDIRPTIITEPGRATALENIWLAIMSEGKDPQIVSRFQQINQYFNGKCSEDEILYRADITRKQLREVLHEYEEYLQTFLHPA
ncbi:unnamed protein product [Somion occarium]|uniref:Nitrogen permease regulator 3 n=1 Tax=Somion occarium TaxID=3059160 RepID=A0ABP1EA99_9APHY